MERPQPRTFLERLIQQSDRTLEETCRDFEQCACLSRERGTLSVRQLGRWMAGEVDNARPSSRRIARQLWGHSFKQLLGPPGVSAQVVTPMTTEVATGVQAAASLDIPTELRTGPTSLEEEIVMAAEESARFVRRSGVAVTPEVLEQLNADVRWLAAEYLRRPPYAVFRPLARLRHDVFDLIDRHPKPSYLPDLYLVGGQLSALLAHASSDLGQPYAADSHTRTAWLCADLAGDNRLRAYIRWVQSNVAYWREDYASAAALAQSGQRYAVARSSDLLRLASQEARALAARHDEHEAERALAIATETREHPADQDRPAGVFYFQPCKAAYYASEVRLSLGGADNARRAVTEAGTALELLRAAPDAEQSAELTAAAQLDLVAAHLVLGDLDATHTHAQAVLQLPTESRTVPILGRVAKIDRALTAEPFRNIALVRELREHVAVFSAHPAARELPQLPA